MAAKIEEPMSEVDLAEDREPSRWRESERVIREYHVLPVHELAPEKELKEVVLAGTPGVDTRRVDTVVVQREHREYAVDVPPAIGAQGDRGVLKHQHVAETKPKKHVKLFPGFTRRSHSDGVHNGEGHEHPHHHTQTHTHEDASHATNGHGGHVVDYGRPMTLTVYPYYLRRISGILRIAELLVGVIVCAAANAEQCTPGGLGVVCGAPSSPLWYGVLGGQGYVLFVGIVFILGNFALIFYHICTRPRDAAVAGTSTATKSRFNFGDKFWLAELIYNGVALVMYIIAASVEAWYASWDTLPVKTPVLAGVVDMSVRNVYKPQWIASAVFAWINVLLYAVHLAITFMFG